MSSMSSRPPSCFGRYGEGLCRACTYTEACRFVKERFVPKSALRRVYEKVREVELKLKS